MNYVSVMVGFLYMKVISLCKAEAKSLLYIVSNCPMRSDHACTYIGFKGAVCGRLRVAPLPPATSGNTN